MCLGRGGGIGGPMDGLVISSLGFDSPRLHQGVRRFVPEMICHGLLSYAAIVSRTLVLAASLINASISCVEAAKGTFTSPV